MLYYITIIYAILYYFIMLCYIILCYFSLLYCFMLRYVVIMELIKYEKRDKVMACKHQKHVKLTITASNGCETLKKLRNGTKLSHGVSKI